MRWSIVWLIFGREVRDQLRDRRTLFMIFVLPMLLYPLLGIGIINLSLQFEEKPRTVYVIGAEFLPMEPRLLNARGDGFDPSLFDLPVDIGRLKVHKVPSDQPWGDPDLRRSALRSGLADAMVIIPPDVTKQLEESGSAQIPVSLDSARESSQDTFPRVREVLRRWKEKMVSSRLARDNRPASYTEPVRIRVEDVARKEERGVTLWARLFPFLLVMMSLTGAFYPAVDLCAGEKERGTMETLLISPASRAEIVIGKFLTVVLASMVTALLNLASMGLTGAHLAHLIRPATTTDSQVSSLALSAPTLASTFWMVVLLIPLSVFFSAFCLALAVLAKSMKEGQYYMTPLYLVSLPLVFLTMAPGIELNLFYSLVPITGVALLLRVLMQGEYDVARHYFLAVLIPTIGYGAVALRWAIDQFKREGVLFREAERFDLRMWMRHLLRDKETTPTAGEAVVCFVVMLTSAWVLFAFMAPTAGSMAAGQVAFILTPPVAMGFLMTSNPVGTLRLRWPRARYLALAVGLALALCPLVSELRVVVEYLFPIPESIKVKLGQLMAKMPESWKALALMAAVPAVCEELAFRGYILSGMQRTYRNRSAIVLSALLFGFLHVLLSLFQQLFNAVLLGIVLGLLAVRSRSIVPCMVFHFLNNALVLLRALPVRDLFGAHLAAWLERNHFSGWLYRNPNEGLYHWPWIALGGLVAAVLILALVRNGQDSAKPVVQDAGSRNLHVE